MSHHINKFNLSSSDRCEPQFQPCRVQKVKKARKDQFSSVYCAKEAWCIFKVKAQLSFPALIKLIIHSSLMSHTYFLVSPKCKLQKMNHFQLAFDDLKLELCRNCGDFQNTVCLFCLYPAAWCSLLSNYPSVVISRPATDDN